MTSLTPKQLKDYNDHGYVAPIDILTVDEANEIKEEIEKIAEKQNVIQNAIKSVQESGIVFIDEIDKIAPNSERRGGDVSREGVQRDLLPLIEGTVVTTKYLSLIHI